MFKRPARAQRQRAAPHRGTRAPRRPGRGSHRLMPVEILAPNSSHTARPYRGARSGYAPPMSRSPPESVAQTRLRRPPAAARPSAPEPHSGQRKRWQRCSITIVAILRQLLDLMARRLTDRHQLALAEHPPAPACRWPMLDHLVNRPARQQLPTITLMPRLATLLPRRAVLLALARVPRLADRSTAAATSYASSSRC